MPNGFSWGVVLAVVVALALLWLVFKFMTTQTVDPATGKIKTLFSPFTGINK